MSKKTDPATWEELVARLTDDEFISELRATEDLVYKIEGFGTKDLIYLEWLCREIERRGLKEAVNWRERDEQNT